MRRRPTKATTEYTRLLDAGTGMVSTAMLLAAPGAHPDNGIAQPLPKSTLYGEDSRRYRGLDLKGQNGLKCEQDQLPGGAQPLGVCDDGDINDGAAVFPPTASAALAARSIAFVVYGILH